MTIDILIVFNMLLTGFDAPRLKRLYFGRKLKDHNLLQAITRVNRPYKDNRYGYVIDFADIKRNFEETNEAYLKELNRFNEVEIEGGLPNIFSHVLEDKETLINKVKEARQILFDYTTDNLEEFSKEISEIEDKEVLLNIKRVLTEARDCFNIVRTFGDDELKEVFKKIEISRLPQMLSELQRHITLINQKEAFNGNEETKMLINEAMEEITFSFKKISEEELKIIAGGVDLNEKWKRAISKFVSNIDKDDPEYITLQEAFMEKFKEKGFVIDTMEEFERKSKEIEEVIKKLNELNRKNRALLNKYKGDKKFVRVHKRIREENNRIEKESKKRPIIISTYDDEIFKFLKSLKEKIDTKIYDRASILKNDAYFGKAVMADLMNNFREHEGNTFETADPNATKENYKIYGDDSDRIFIRDRIVKEYLSQYNETYRF